jgi:hypothetical protein
MSRDAPGKKGLGGVFSWNMEKLGRRVNFKRKPQADGKIEGAVLEVVKSN